MAALLTSSQPSSLALWFDLLVPSILVWGWLFVLFLTLWTAWSAYQLLKMIDYTRGIEWTYLQITIPSDAEQTPKAMEYAIEVWGGIHKNPDLIEKFFEGYLEAWYSMEVQCLSGRARYIMVVPAVHRNFFEGVIYGQYPTAEVREVEDYTLRYSWRDIEKTFDIYGTKLILTQDEIYPIKTYIEYEDSLAPEDKFIDPHQSIIEAYTNIQEGEEYWFQILVRPVDAGDFIEPWVAKGEEEITKISGQAKKKPAGILSSTLNFFLGLPGELLRAAMGGPIEAGQEERERPQLRFFNPVDEAKMKGILQKISRGGFKTLVRVIYIAPVGQLHKPNISRAIGVFKQFNTFHLNSFAPDPNTKTNGPNYFLKQTRRRFRKRQILLHYQWRDHWGANSGEMFNAEELATLYHFPAKWVPAPGIERAKSGLESPPENLPYA